MGQHQEAVEHYRQALAIAQQIGDPWGKGPTLINLGAILTKLGQYEEAMARLKAGLEIIQAQEARSLEASAYKYLGMLYQATGEAPTALAHIDMF